MIIKKYQGKTEAEALEQARKELGDKVVTMSVRSKKKKGLFAFIFPAMIEVTVALDDNQAQTAPITAPAPLSPAAVSSAAMPAAGQTATKGQVQLKTPAAPKSGGLLPDELIAQSIPESLRDKEPLFANTQFNPQPSRPAGAPSAVVSQRMPINDMPQSQQTAGLGGLGIEERLDSLQNLIEKQMINRPAPAAQESKPTDNNGSETGKTNDSFVKLLYDTMVDNEVSPENADIIIKEIEGTTNKGQSIDHLLANVYQKMILKFGKSVGIRPADKGVKVLFFVGPTGVGKTTTIAKIASRFRVEEKKRVALLTADTYRIAAAEQLSTYASILDVPFRIVYTPHEMTGALSEYMDYDYVLVDTAGHSHNNEAQKENMNQFIHSVDGVAESEVFLVVSSTTKYKDLLKIADSYKNMTDYKLIFTKLDETTGLGNLLNLKLYTGSEISYVTCGQNVPDDIENFNPQKTVKQLLGGKR